MTIGEITFMGKSRIMSTGGLLWGLLGLNVDYIIGGFGMFKVRAVGREHPSGGGGLLCELIWLENFDRHIYSK